MKKLGRLAILNLCFLLLHIGLAMLAQFRMISNEDVAGISDQYPALFTPSGTTFLIWWIIYPALLVFTLYHLSMAFARDEQDPANRDLKRIGTLFMINNAAAAAWLAAWVTHSLSLSLGLILVQLVCLAAIVRRLNIHDARRTWRSKVFTQFPLSIYTGWITIATVANLFVWFRYIGWSGWGVSEINWTITGIALLILFTVQAINRRKNVFYGLVILWALYGIIQKRTVADPEGSAPIIMIAWIAIAIIAIACLFGLIRNLREK